MKSAVINVYITSGNPMGNRRHSSSIPQIHQATPATRRSYQLSPHILPCGMVAPAIESFPLDAERLERRSLRKSPHAVLSVSRSGNFDRRSYKYDGTSESWVQ